jgi:hypothetical protein
MSSLMSTLKALNTELGAIEGKFNFNETSFRDTLPNFDLMTTFQSEVSDSKY